MEKQESASTVVQIGPNPALKGGDVHVASLYSAKQTVYAERRQRHTADWFAAEARWHDAGVPSDYMVELY